MKYLKYFESLSHDDIKKTITEICYDITDDNRLGVLFRSSSMTKSNRNEVIIRGEPFPNYKEGFLLSDIEDTILRIKDFLGPRRFYGFSAVVKVKGSDDKVIDIRDIGKNDLGEENRILSLIILYEPIEWRPVLGI